MFLKVLIIRLSLPSWFGRTCGHWFVWLKTLQVRFLKIQKLKKKKKQQKP